MNYGFDEKKFYFDFHSCSRPVGNMKEENDRRAVELASANSKIMLSLSSGLDSQSVLHSFHTQNIPLDTYFMYLPGYNDNEYENLKVLDKKYQIKTNIIDIDVDALRQDLEEETVKTGVHKYSLLWKKFLSMLPDDYDFIQMAHDPFIHISQRGQYYYYIGYNSPEVMRNRAFSLLNRKGKVVFYGNTPEFLLSILDEDIFKAALYSHAYFDGNGLSKKGVKLTTIDRWDYYIKPLIYGRYWKDQLIYFGKFVGFENLGWLAYPPLEYRKHGISIPYFDLVNHLKLGSGNIKRFYENVNS
jgi:hypothetical protein